MEEEEDITSNCNVSVTKDLPYAAFWPSQSVLSLAPIPDSLEIPFLQIYQKLPFPFIAASCHPNPLFDISGQLGKTYGSSGNSVGTLHS